MARLHLNCFRIPPTPTLEGGQEGARGTVVYLLTSMYNHGCGTDFGSVNQARKWVGEMGGAHHVTLRTGGADPNVDIGWPIDACAELRARKNIKAGGEGGLCISVLGHCALNKSDFFAHVFERVCI